MWCVCGVQVFPCHHHPISVFTTITFSPPLLSGSLTPQVYIRNVVTATEYAILDLRRTLFNKILRQDISFFDKSSPGDLTSLLSSQLGILHDFIIGNVSRDRGIRSFMETIGSCLVLCYLSHKLAPVLSAVVLSLSMFAALYGRWTKGEFASDALTQRKMNDVAGEAFENIRTVRTFNGENREQVRGPQLYGLPTYCLSSPSLVLLHHE